jgi:hypothetical protein
MRTKAIALGLMLAIAAPAFGVMAVGARHHKRKHKPTWFEYRVFVPSHENLLSQNQMIDDLGLPRIKNDAALRELIASDELVPITADEYVRVCYKLESKRRYVRPWVDYFLQDLGQEYYRRFGEAIQVNSAVRTERVQWHLLHINHNAAPVHGEAASAHLAGVAVDLQRRGLTQPQVRFIQQKLLYLSKLNMVIVEEELKQPCFHVVVTGEYPGPPPPMPRIELKLPNLLFSTEVPNGHANDLDNTSHP